MRNNQITSFSISNSIVTFIHNKGGKLVPKTFVPTKGSMQRVNTTVEKLKHSGELVVLDEDGLTIGEFVS